MEDQALNQGAPAPPARTGNGRFAVFAPLLVIGLAALGSLVGVLLFLNRGTPPKRDLAAEARADLERRNFRPLSEPLQALLADARYRPIPTQTHPLLLGPAPDFSLREVNGGDWSLSQELKKGPVVLIFYYGYHCNHCVSQLFGIDQDIDKFRELGVRVAAVSADAPELTRERFAEYGAFRFPVLSDPGNKVAEKYGVFTPSARTGEEGDLMHGTFLISRQGKVLWTNRGDNPFTENRTLLHEIARAEGRAPKK
ncbi:MAG: redoxin domain-containing protein [Planctomycetes bacterium]|nr:redoxin domain-containing protein [Planctomycetota bacterium]